MSEEQWAAVEAAVRQAIRELPDADQFTVNEVGRIVARVRRINNDVLDTFTEAAQGIEIGGLGQVFEPVYSYLIGEVVSLCVEVVRIDRKMGDNHES